MTKKEIIDFIKRRILAEKRKHEVGSEDGEWAKIAACKIVSELEYQEELEAEAEEEKELTPREKNIIRNNNNDAIPCDEEVEESNFMGVSGIPEEETEEQMRRNEVCNQTPDKIELLELKRDGLANLPRITEKINEIIKHINDE